LNFSITTQDKSTSARTGVIKTEHGDIQTPVFMPVGTIGAVKTFSPHELEGLGADIILGNTYHLYLRPGAEVINHAGGLHKFSNWTRPILTDSGGFQVFSLANLNKINDDGVEFQSHLDGSYHTITPEISMQIQRALGSDIIMAFDHCPPGKSELNEVTKAVKRTNEWFIRCKNYLKDNPRLYKHSQTLFPIIQGGINHKMREMSIEGLVPQADFGIAIGGLAVGEEKNAMFDTIEFCDSLLPKDRPRYLMGVGRPTDIVKAIRRGVDMFDCVMPTRNGRNGQIFTSNGTINITNEKYKDDHSFIDEDSNHAFGRMFTKAYIRHLFNVKEILGLRIASTLNLSFYISLIKKIQELIHLGEFDSWSSSWLNEMKYHRGM
jgi:queuine tRNA-ribosyltransferase